MVIADLRKIQKICEMCPFYVFKRLIIFQIINKYTIFTKLLMSLEENIFMARVAEQAERFDDMVLYLNKVVESKSEDFTTEERNLLSVGFKNQIGSKRTAIRTISAIE